ncbi:hypothetical protein GYMLUDRAFT_917277 [Collybiopsis luxurians FD-317 M1]|uniref:Uncharacterized protein n=1 Tax=Collybiopsis luxurians FD-317 M1 TaxID=944289 RepID=A0A0D0C874_9AGAR|nr:hypothetical protein GYMLUDRAFT_917277 [Collybiopsis luxurians FD-317 M1]
MHLDILKQLPFFKNILHSQKGVPSRPHLIVLLLQCCLLISSALTFIDFCATPLSQIQTIVIQPDASHDSLEEKLNAFQELQAPSLFFYIINWLSGGINIIIADTLVMWRAWAVWREKKFAKWLCIFLSIGNAVVIVLTNVIWITGEPHESLATAFKLNLFLLVSMTLNALSTSAIAYKARAYSKWRNVFGKEYKSRSKTYGTPVHKVLWFVVESGFIFCLLQAAFYAVAIASAISSSLNFFDAYNAIIQPLALMLLQPYYPTAVFAVSLLLGNSEN